jgi:CRP/FNR family transcriptional regulator, cyclic AMP receptor protein
MTPIGQISTNYNAVERCAEPRANMLAASLFISIGGWLRPIHYRMQGPVTNSHISHIREHEICPINFSRRASRLSLVAPRSTIDLTTLEVVMRTRGYGAGGDRSAQAGAARNCASAVEKAAVLSRNSFFRGLGPEIRERIAAHAATKCVKRGVTIVAKGDVGSCLFLVCRGTVEIATVSAGGKKAIVNFIKEGEVFGEVALLDGQERTADAIAFTDCVLMMIERRDLLPLLLERPDVALRLLEALCARVRRMTEQVEELMFLNVEGRLGRTLYRLSASKNSPHRISITQRVLGEIVGVSREETNKHLQIWSGNGIVRLERGGIVVLRPAALAEVAV